MIYYLSIGIVFSLFYNFDVFFYGQEGFIYKVWSLIIVTIFFPVALFIHIMDMNEKTSLILDNIINFIVDIVEK